MKKTTQLSSVNPNGVRTIKKLFFLLLLIVFSSNGFAVTYYSKATGNANLVATWGINPADGTGTAPANFTTSGDIFILRSTSALTMNSSWTIGSGVLLQVAGSLNVSSNNNGVTIVGIVAFTNVSATQLSITGNINSFFTVNSGATFRTANINGIRGTNASLPTTPSQGSINLNAGATYEFNGAANQTANGLLATISNLIVNNNNTVTLTQPTIVSTLLTLTSGNLNIGANNLTVENISVTTPSATKMIVASGGGEVRKTFTANGSFTFPVGDNTATAEYSPITVTITGSGFSSAYAGVKVTDAKHPNNASAVNFLTRFWAVTQSGITGATIAASATYPSADITGAEASIAAARLTGTFNQASNPWFKFGILGSNTLTASAGTLAAGTTAIYTGITAENPNVAINGGGGVVCTGTNVPLSTIVTGDPSFTYSWSPATFLSSSTIANPVVTAPTVTTTYTVTVKDGNGISTSNVTTIAVANLPNAGADQTSAATCGLTLVTLDAATPNVGVGSWSIVSGIGGSFTGGSGNPSNSSATNAAFSGNAGGTYVLRWTISGSPCVTTFDDMTVIFNQNPTTATNTSGQTICVGSSGTLLANTPAVGTGAWSITSGPNLSLSQISDITNPLATFTPGPAGSYVLRWTISNAPCTASFANATVIVAANVTYYADADGDTFGDLASPSISCTGAPTGYVLNSTDCNDNDNTKNAQFAFYVDGDGDGFGVGSFVNVCAVNAVTPPTGYSSNNTDCNDSNNAINATFSFYVDNDTDGFGTGSATSVCAVDAFTPPTGYSLNNTDCNDNDNTKNAEFAFYVDADVDGDGDDSERV